VKNIRIELSRHDDYLVILGIHIETFLGGSVISFPRISLLAWHHQSSEGIFIWAQWLRGFTLC